MMMAENERRWQKAPWRHLRAAFAWASLAIGLYFAAILLGSLIAANPGWREPESGVEIFVETNGVHTGIVMPIANGIADWRDLLRPEDIRDPRYYSTHILVGWGDEDFYRETATWSDLSLPTTLKAAIGSNRTLMHVDHLYRPKPLSYRRRVILSEAQYARLSGVIRAQFALDEAGRADSSYGYGPADAFYRAKGHYSAFNTCNSWTGRVLRDAGVRVGIWTPTSGGVMRWFPEEVETE